MTLPLTSPELTPTVNDEEFSFTMAIGRYTAPPNTVVGDGRMEIDVSIAPKSHHEDAESEEAANVKHYGLYPVASMDDRRIAAVIDFACLLFAYGGFMALFSTLGGQFSATKLNAVVYAATFAVVYLQYFALFTIFGGTTPGMMFRRLQVASFSGAPPTPRQYLLRSIGYVASAAAVFAGFAWSWWDEDHLTWHDRISRTYLSSPTTTRRIPRAQRCNGSLNHIHNGEAAFNFTKKPGVRYEQSPPGFFLCPLPWWPTMKR